MRKLQSVLLLDLDDEAATRWALMAVFFLEGIRTISIKKKSKEMTVVGAVDPTDILRILRMFCPAELLLSMPADEPHEEEEEEYETNERQEGVRKQMDLQDETATVWAFTAVFFLGGIDSVSIDKASNEMAVDGEADQTDILRIFRILRIFCLAEKKGTKKEEPEEEEKVEPNTPEEDERGKVEAEENEEALSAFSIGDCLEMLDYLVDELDSVVQLDHSFDLEEMVRSDNLRRGQLSDGLQDHLRQLGTSLRKAQALLRFPELQQTEAKELPGLLAQLKLAGYGTANLLRRRQYQFLRQMILRFEPSDRQSSSSSSSSSSFDANPSRFISEMRKYGKELDAISSGIREIVRQDEILSAETDTIFSEIKPQVFGNEAKESLIQVLLRSADGSGSSKSNFSVLSIAGNRKAGKTTSAKLLYNDLRVQKHFELKYWVNAAWSFDAKQLIKEIIESDTEEKQSNLTDLDSLQLILKEKVMSRRFLLVLDDVWIEDSSEWQKLYAPLNHGLQGSMILVTTQSLEVAKKMGTSCSIFLAGLTDDVISRASDLMKLEVDPELEVIGKRIAAKLKGSPLAVKLIGGLLNSKMDAGRWRKIYDRIRALSHSGYDIGPVVRLSYRYLPARLRRCFPFCSIFPKDYMFRQDDLVFRWMALGFIAPRENTRMEDVATSYFQDLTVRCFFEQSQLNHQYYVMHGRTHDLAEYVSTNECIRIEDGQFRESNPSTVRHLSICTRKLEPSKLIDLTRCNKLLSLTVMKNIELDLRPIIDCWFERLTNIQLLDLNACEIEELPESIGNLKQLRYIDISYTGIGRLPDSFCCLHNLQFLFIKGCEVESFPKAFTNLINLRTIDIESFSMITEIGKLTSLQELPRFEVLKEDGHSIGELKDLTQLHRSLTVKNLENVESMEDACQAKLDNKEYLSELVLEWSLSRNTSLGCDYFTIDENVLEALQPHPNLKELEIRFYRGMIAPSWLCTQMLPSLVKLAIQHCPSLLNLPCLPPSLTVLELVNVGLDSLPILWGDGSTDECTTKQRRSSITRSSLSKLSILQCRNLTSLAQLEPRWLPAVRSMCIEDCRGLVSLPVEMFGGFVFLEFLEIIDCPNLRCPGEMVFPPSIKRLTLDSCGDLDKSLPNCLQRLTSLVYLNIYRCPHIESLTWQVFHHLRALRSLYICECLVLRSLSGLEALTSLQELTILKCPQLEESESLFDKEEQQKGMSPLKLTTDKTELLRLPFLRNLSSSSLNLVIWESSESAVFVREDEEWLQILRTLRELSFESCANLKSLPSWFCSLTSLEKLRICNCPQITSLPEENLPTSLTDLYFDN